MMVVLFWQEGKLANASLEEFQFWTENAENYLVDQNEANGDNLLELRVS